MECGVFGAPGPPAMPRQGRRKDQDNVTTLLLAMVVPLALILQLMKLPVQVLGVQKQAPLQLG